ncbi:phytanoyl-CoA dioxygenase domain-containing protein 1 isoform X1 [Odontomachus brunneus]|uniref:phytanoyl-CoA dioxygenase domain-containing protein 1 isoform X1 n=2 Tax=Odontomachus brunneus TaxID=486640 RepID=UPI0013F28F92|nr:phytanoyl-CoA dioxygenase domain-containing protein 1 isoform X1 [Odontomachus brunneus]
MMNVSQQIKDMGYAVLEDFLRPHEIEELRSCGQYFTKNLPPESEREIFDTKNEQQADYFLDSANKISVFFEAEALEKDGALRVNPEVSLNKVGHALHWLHPSFKKYTFDERVKEVAFQLNYKEPAVCQSMYIYKNPTIGSEVTTHQDATYLYTEPATLLGFWIALDDATQENGCLWIAPGSHKSGVHRRFIRNKESCSKQLLVFDKAAPHYSQSCFTPVPVRKGTCILLHGQVLHFSAPNRSNLPRHAYTFHVIETHDVTYAKDNWLQPLACGFPKLYLN